jgi:soluble lytic murein transglycosylase-like protein
VKHSFKSRLLPALLTALAATSHAHAADTNAAATNAVRHIEHITLSSGFELDCIRHEAIAAEQKQTGERVRLYLSQANFIDVAATQIISIESRTEIPQPQLTAAVPQPLATHATSNTPLTRQELHPLLARAGTAHNIDADLLWSVVKAESAGNPHAVSPVGAQGLMQLMPGTASSLGVHNSFAAEENIAGGAAYLDILLTRYHDNLMLALAAYNAGPEAVDRYHGIPPYRETRLYVARVIREFNKRKLSAAQQHETAATLAPQNAPGKTEN